MSELKIDLTESFPRLAHAPIVEAVIEVRARAEAPWEEAVILERLKSRLPDYPASQSQQSLQFEFKVEPGKTPEQAIHDLGWKGLRFESADKLHVAQFNRELFSFSRLRPYDSWNQFSTEALRLWQIHSELAQPIEVQRLGVRFINRTAVPSEGRLENYMQVPPQTPRNLELPFANFLHHDTLLVPGHPYAINVIQTVQSPHGPGTEAAALILDIDVYTIQPFELRDNVFPTRLAEMRWLKNKVFFGSITPQALKNF
ncbi:MAG: TIGR04255 family protein [Gammaproteobacteria bacterium]